MIFPADVFYLQAKLELLKLFPNKTPNMKKIFKNSSGNIVITKTPDGWYQIVDMRIDNGDPDSMIGYWVKNKEGYPEFTSVEDKFINTKYDFDIFKALKFGQRLAEILTETKKQ